MLVGKVIAQNIMNKFGLGKVKTLKFIEKGIVNPVYEINKKYILRLHIREPHLLKLEKEAYLYNLIKERTDVPVPKLKILDTSKTIIPCNYSIVYKIKGKDLDEVRKKLTKKELAKISYDLGVILAKIHSIRIGKKFGDVLDVGKRYNTWYEDITHFYKRLIRNHRKYKIIPKKVLDKIQAKFKEHDKLLRIKCKPVLLHGDCHTENVRVKNKKIVGIFDFEWARLGHNEFDFKNIMLPSKKGRIDLDEFLNGYRSMGKLSKDFFTRVRLYKIIYCLDLIEAAHLHFNDDKAKIKKHTKSSKEELSYL